MRSRLIPAFAIVFSVIAARGAAGEAADIDKWIEQLGSEDFDTRETAAAELGKRSEKIWDRLEKLSKGENADVRILARRAMGAAGKRALTKMVEAQNADLAEHEKWVVGAVAEFKPIEEAVRTTREAQEDAIKNRIINTNDATRAAEAAAAKAKEAAAARYAKACDELNAKRKNWQREQNVRLSRLDQLKSLLESDEVVLPADLADWKPEKLPFAKRLNCYVTFEIADIPLTEAAAQYKSLCGLNVELDSTVKESPSFSLKVTAMNAEVSLAWLCRMADLEYTIDWPGKKVIIHKPKK